MWDSSGWRSWKVIISAGVGLLIGVFLLAFTSAGLIYEYEDSLSLDELPRGVDAIVVLAGARGRITEASDLWLRFYRDHPSRTPLLYVSGMGHQANWNVFAKQVKPEVLNVIRANDVILETQSTTTEENAMWLLNYVQERKWKHVVLVTSNYHMKRSLYIFQTVLGSQVNIDTHSVQPEPYRDGKWYKDLLGIQITLSEFLKWVFFRAFVRA